VVAALSEYIKNLEHFKSLVEANDFNGLYNQMEQTNRIKDILTGLAPQHK
jgi:prephenate dehydrogenase